MAKSAAFPPDILILWHVVHRFYSANICKLCLQIFQQAPGSEDAHFMVIGANPVDDQEVAEVALGRSLVLVEGVSRPLDEQLSLLQ